MGYNTTFKGKFTLNKKLDEETHKFLIKFNETRRMKRNMERLFCDSKASEYGVDGEFYADGVGYMGQDDDASVVDSNTPPSTQPSLWCQWRPSDDGKAIEWDGSEKFYSYGKWLQYIINNFLTPKGYTLSGSVEYQGEEPSDRGWLNTLNGAVWTSRTSAAIPPPAPIPVREIPKRHVNWR